MKPEKLLTKTILTAEQYEQVKNFPAAKKYRVAPDGRYVQSVKITKALFKAKQKAEKFVLMLSANLGARYYLKEVGDKILLTTDVKEATHFALGFDVPHYCTNKYLLATNLNWKVQEIIKLNHRKEQHGEAPEE